MRTHLLPWLLLPILACASTESAATGPSSRDGERPPNILFVFADDHACNAIGAYGSSFARTPRIDRLAGEGMLFRHSLVGNAICAPARATILTGLHSHRNGLIDNSKTFDGSQTTFPKLLRAAGYQTALIGKWHLKSDPTGFDHWEVLVDQGPYYNPVLLAEDGKHLHEGYTTDILTERALEWLEGARASDKPFCLMLQHKAPHRLWAPEPDHMEDYEDETIPEPATLFDDWRGRASPAHTQEMTIAQHLTPSDLKLVPPRELDEAQLARWNQSYEPRNAAYEASGLEGEALVRWKYQRYMKDYLRCIESVDESLGQVLDWLEAHGLAENTVVVYSSDQGFYLGEHGWFDKRWMYEESLHTPLIVRWPGHVAPGASDSHLVQNIDLAPTFLDLAGLSAPSAMQGVSLRPLLEGEPVPDWRRSVYYHYYEFPGAHSVAKHYGVRTERYKLIHYYELGEWELFDLQNDSQELHSRYDDPAYASVRAELEAELRRLRTLYGDTATGD